MKVLIYLTQIISKKAYFMKQYSYWTKEEEDILERLWLNPKVIWEDIERVFVNRTRRAIRHKIIQLRLPNYTAIRATSIDKEYLRQLLEVIEG